MRNIAVGQQYLAAIDSSAERTLVTVIAKRHHIDARMSGKGGYPARVETKVVTYTVVESSGLRTTGVKASDLHPTIGPVLS